MKRRINYKFFKIYEIIISSVIILNIFRRFILYKLITSPIFCGPKEHNKFKQSDLFWCYALPLFALSVMSCSSSGFDVGFKEFMPDFIEWFANWGMENGFAPSRPDAEVKLAF